MPRKAPVVIPAIIATGEALNIVKAKYSKIANKTSLKIKLVKTRRNRATPKLSREMRLKSLAQLQNIHVMQASPLANQKRGGKAVKRTPPKRMNAPLARIKFLNKGRTR